MIAVPNDLPYTTYVPSTSPTEAMLESLELTVTREEMSIELSSVYTSFEERETAV